jgi:hypothetical protein
MSVLVLLAFCAMQTSAFAFETAGKKDVTNEIKKPVESAAVPAVKEAVPAAKEIAPAATEKEGEILPTEMETGNEKKG